VCTPLHCLIICNGEVPNRQLVDNEYRSHDLLIAADGGAEYCDRYGLTPDLIVGDMDSYTAERNDLRILQDSDQETNDLEKALAYAKKQKATHCTILGATGQRLDQTLKNLSVLIKFNSCFKQLVIKDNYGDAYLLPKQHHLTLPVHTTVSLIPLSGKVTGIELEGFRYPLNHETLQNGVRDGTSNITTSPEISIAHKTGDLLIFIHKPERSNN